MPTIRRGGYVFLAWKGGHGPRHVHVYRDGRLVMKGSENRRVREIVAELRAEGLL
jgi:hypothetical protein